MSPVASSNNFTKTLWSLWTIWNPLLSQIFRNNSSSDLLDDDAETNVQPLIGMSKEEFGEVISKAIKRTCPLFEPLDMSFILVKINKAKFPKFTDNLLYIDEAVYYSKISKKLDLDVEEIMFTGTGRSYSHASPLIRHITAYEELATILTASLCPSDILLICGNWDSVNLDENKLILNQPRPTKFIDSVGNEIIIPAKETKVSASGVNLTLVRFPSEDCWKTYSRGQALVEQVIPAPAKSFFKFSYTAALEDRKLNRTAIELEKFTRTYTRSKYFTIDDYLKKSELNANRRTTNNAEQEEPFQIPITREVDPFEVYQIMINSKTLSCLMPTQENEKSDVRGEGDRNNMVIHSAKNWRNTSTTDDKIGKRPPQTNGFEWTDDEDGDENEASKPPRISSSSGKVSQNKTKARISSEKNSDRLEKFQTCVIIMLAMISLVFAIYVNTEYLQQLCDQLLSRFYTYENERVCERQTNYWFGKQHTSKEYLRWYQYFH